jgi:hypothetical protein
MRTVTSQTRQGSGHDWDDARKAALFADIVSLKLSIEEAARQHGLRVDVIQEWLRLFRRSALLAFDERLKKTLIDQGANADTLTAAEFTGHIEDISIADLVQTIEIAGKDAVITVTHGSQSSRIWCSAGAIIDAESGRLMGEGAVYRILALEHGRMVADLRPEPRVRTIYAATHRLLIEAMRRKDEVDRLEYRLGDTDRFYRLGERSTHARVHVSTDELSLLRLFDGPRRVGDVMAQSTLGDLETLTALERLVNDGYLTVAEAAPLPASLTGDVDSEPDSDSDPLRGALDDDLDDELDASAAGVTPAHAEEPSSPTSFGPVAISERLERRAPGVMPRWVYAAITTAVLGPAAFWFGETMFNMRASRIARSGQQAAAASAVASDVSSLGDPTDDGTPTFVVSTRVEPSTALIWLDHHPVATGRLGIVLPKDGTTHELRVAADGFIPTTLLFADVPPPREIRLETLKLPAPPAAEARTRLPEAPSTVTSALRAQPPRPAPRRRPPVERPRAINATQKGALELVPFGEPHVQIIDEDPPNISVIE